jgi:oligopeptide/dipeptide ABC transporter ATP-binding protein
MSYLFIAHDLAVVRHISDRVSVMYAGRIVETGTRDEVFESASHPYTRALLAATGEVGMEAVAAEPGAREALLGGCEFRDRCPVAQVRCAEEVPELIDRGTGHPVACHFPEVTRSSAPHPRIDSDDGHIGKQVDHRYEQAGDDADAHDEGGVEAGQPQQ